MEGSRTKKILIPKGRIKIRPTKIHKTKKDYSRKRKHKRKWKEQQYE